MSEKEIRSILQIICDDLDRGARQAIRSGVRKVILPSMLGVSLACSGCSDRGAVTMDAATDARGEMVPGPDATYGVPDGYPIMDLVYMAPDGTPLDGGVAPPYMAPDAMAPDGTPLDGGVAPPYMAPDAGPPQRDYMGPDPDGGSALLYAAPDPDGEA